MIIVRAETPEDYTAIHEVNVLAFDKRENEARLVETIRQSPGFTPELSLVAIEDGQVIGHVLFSPIRIETEIGDAAALALAPIAVRPEAQNRGIGSQLIRHGLDECRRLGHRIVVLIGHSNYYPRFGFSPARAMGLEAPFPIPDDVFMALELVPGALKGVKGTVRYPPAFDDV
jgi:putative acetyltransferase